MIEDEEFRRLKDELVTQLVTHTISRAHALILAIGTIVVVIATAYGVYLTTISDIRKQIELNERSVDAKIAQLRLERETAYVKKEEMAAVNAKLDGLTVSLATLNGLIQGQNQGRVTAPPRRE